MPDTKYFSNVQSKSTGEVYVVKDKDARDMIDAKADNTPTFTEASTRANIASGETIPTILGKIKKFFTDLKAVAFSGSYTDLSDKPTIPAAANNGTLTIQKNGTNVQTFTANQSTNATANITVPTKTSELTNDSGYITGSYLPLSGGNMTGNISYAGTKATYPMIKFIDNTSDAYGNGISIGGGGATIIGGGESSDVMAAQQSSGGEESMLIGNDGDVHIYTNLQSGWDYKKDFNFNNGGDLTIPRYLYSAYLQQSSGAETPNSSSYIMFANSDGFLRKSSIANINSLISPYEAYLQWGGKNFTGSYGCIDAAMVSDLNANRFFGIRAAGITIEYTRDGGSTWIDYGASDTAKQALFTNGTAFYIGKADSSNKATANGTKYQLRITIDTPTSNVYTELKKIVLYISTNGSASCTCKVQGVLKENSSDTGFIDITSDIDISGWSGYNVINTSFVAGNSFNGQYRKVRFLFKANGGQTNYIGLNVQQIMAYGGVGWTTPTTMAKTGHLYVADSNLKATFPAELEATALYENGTALSSKYAAKSDATTSASGLMSASDKTKLNGIATGAEVNQNAFSNVVVGSTTIAADGKTDTLTLTAGSNITLTPDATNDKVTIAATNTTYDAMSTSELTTGTATTQRTVRADYLKSGINSLIDTKIGELDVASVGGSGKYISAISEADGKISATATNFPTIPAAANNGTLTIQKNGTNVQTFTANQSTNATANITVPTALSDLTADATHRTVSDTEKTTWNGKADKSTNYGNANTYYLVLHNTSDNKDYYSLNNSNNNYISFEKSGNEYYEKIYSTGGEGGYSTLSSTALNFQPYRNDSVTYSYEGITIGNSTTLTKTKLSYLNNITSDVQAQINGKAASSHTHNYAGSSSAGGSANSAVYANSINATYSGNGGQQGPSYFGKNRLGSLMSNQTINGDSAYKNWIYMDGYNGSDVGGASAIGVDRYYGSNTTPRAFIMTSDANRTSWNASAELITTANVSQYGGGTKWYKHIVDIRVVNQNTYRSRGGKWSNGKSYYVGIERGWSTNTNRRITLDMLSHSFDSADYETSDIGAHYFKVISTVSKKISNLDDLTRALQNGFSPYYNWQGSMRGGQILDCDYYNITIHTYGRTGDSFTNAGLMGLGAGECIYRLTDAMINYIDDSVTAL